MLFFQVPSLCFLASKCSRNKSTLIKFELYKGKQLKIYEYAIIFCANTNDKYNKIINSDFICYNYSDKVLAKILKFWKEKVE
jgi:hypothetical protein